MHGEDLMRQPAPMPAPYPADTRAKGWRFELDYERIRQSDTWALASPDVRPWLLMLWMVAWEQTPCGSLPADDDLIAARLGMPLAFFAECRPVVLRGWWLASDGRLYNDVLVERVTEMMQARRKESDRKALARARASTAVPPVVTLPVPPDNHGTTPVLPRESDTGTGTGTSEDQYNPPPPSVVSPPASKSQRKPTNPTPERPDGVDAQVWLDWLALRSKKRAPVTATVLTEAAREAEKAGLSIDGFLRVWCARGSQGLQAEWLQPSERAPPQNRRTTAAEQRILDAVPGLAAPHLRAPKQPLAEVFDVTARLVG